MRFSPVLLLLSAGMAADMPSSNLWSELKTKREKLPSIHQEFELSRTSKTTSAERSSKQQVIVDVSQGQWREKTVSGSGTQIRIYNGTDVFWMEEGGDEFVRSKARSKKGDILTPSVYASDESDWSKAREVERRPCAISGSNDTCVVIEVPLKATTRMGPESDITKILQGIERMVLDTETGLLLVRRTIEVMENRRGPYQLDVTYTAKRMSYGSPADVNLFKLPSETMRQVKQLSSWNAARFKKQLLGHPAPDFTFTDMQGRSVALAGLKGKTVLLDFWTTWCPPCRADGPALEKLYRKYGARDLTIIGVSVSEERAVVQKFLKEHPHAYPVVLTTENDMPRPYQVGVLPTYIVIDRDGAVAAAVEGDKGFSELQRLLKKAGLEYDDSDTK